MVNKDDLTVTANPKNTNELGMLLCKVCVEVIHTLPTNGVKKIYGLCTDKDCTHKKSGGTLS